MDPALQQNREFRACSVLTSSQANKQILAYTLVFAFQKLGDIFCQLFLRNKLLVKYNCPHGNGQNIAVQLQMGMSLEKGNSG